MITIRSKRIIESLQSALEVARLTTIEVDEVNHKVSYYFGGDWRLLVLIVQNQNLFDNLYNCGKDEHHDMLKCRSISDPTLRARTVEVNTVNKEKGVQCLTLSFVSLSSTPRYGNQHLHVYDSVDEF